VEYSCMIWTYFIEQMDKLIESINYASRTYWGDPSRFQFYSSIESFQDTTTFNTGEDRLVRSSFNMTLNGYLIPNSINKSISVANRAYGVSNIIFGLETSTSSEMFNANINKKPSAKLSNIIASDSQNIINNVTNVPSAVITYINTNKELTATYVDSTTITFGPWLPAPSGLPPTSIDNFTFFCNGQFIERSAIISFTQSNSISTLVIDPIILQYSFEQSDIITGIGKFS